MYFYYKFPYNFSDFYFKLKFSASFDSRSVIKYVARNV